MTNATKPRAEEAPQTTQDCPQSPSEDETQENPQPVPYARNRPLSFGQFQEGVSAILATLEPMTAVPSPPPDGPMIYRLMAAALDQMPAVGKDQRNEQQGFSYRGVDDVLDHLNPILGRLGIFFVPAVVERVAEVRQTRSHATLWTVHLRVRYTFYAPDGSSVEAVGWGEGTDMADKATSKAMTMAMKSVIFQVFAISDHEVDPDSTSEPSEPPPLPKPPLSAEDRDALQAQIDGLSAAAADKLKELWIGQKGKLPGLKQATEDHVPDILAMIAQAEALAEQDDRLAEAHAE